MTRSLGNVYRNQLVQMFYIIPRDSFDEDKKGAGSEFAIQYQYTKKPEHELKQLPKLYKMNFTNISRLVPPGVDKLFDIGRLAAKQEIERMEEKSQRATDIALLYQVFC